MIDELTKKRLDGLGPEARKTIMETIEMREANLVPWLQGVPTRLEVEDKVALSMTIKLVLEQLIKANCKVVPGVKCEVQTNGEVYFVADDVYVCLKVLIIYSNMGTSLLSDAAHNIVVSILSNIKDGANIMDLLYKFKAKNTAEEVLVEALEEIFGDANEAFKEWAKLTRNLKGYATFFYNSNVFVNNKFKTKQDLQAFLESTFKKLNADEEYYPIIKALKLTKAQSAMMYALRDIPGITLRYSDNKGFMGG